MIPIKLGRVCKKGEWLQGFFKRCERSEFFCSESIEKQKSDPDKKENVFNHQSSNNLKTYVVRIEKGAQEPKFLLLFEDGNLNGGESVEIRGIRHCHAVDAISSGFGDRWNVW